MSTPASNIESRTPVEAGFGLADFLRVMRERRGLIRSITVCVVALTAAVMLLLPTLYSTSAVVMLDQRKNNVADQSSVLSALPTDPSSVQNQIQVLSSRDLALKVIATLKLYADPEFNPALDKSALPDLNPLHWPRPAAAPGGDARDRIVNTFLAGLDVRSLGLSTSIEVGYTARDPRKAALIANAIARTYTEDQVATKIEAARKAAAWLSERIRQLSAQVQQQEAAVEQYKAEYNLVDAAEGKSLVDQQLMAINTQLVQAQSGLAEKKAAYERVAALAKTGNAADVTQVVTSKMIGDLRTQEAELVRQEADLASRYGPNHPKMVAMRNEKRDLAAKIAREVASVAGSMESELAVARAHVGSIQASLQNVEKQARDDNMARIKLNSLQANLASTRTIYESFVSRLRAVQDQDDMQIPEARVISTAPVPAAPSSPHRTLFVAASIPAGLLLGILVALLVERFQAPPAPDIRARPAPPPQAAQAPAMASLPPVLATLAATTDLRVADGIVDNIASPYGRALASLVQVFVPARGTPRVVALTSATSDYGKAVVALSLARVAASMGLRTLLIDADLGRSVPGAGIGAVLAGARLDRVLQKDRRTGAFLLSGAGPVWNAPRIAELFAHLRANCDLILVDAPAAGRSDAWPVLARLCDGVVLLAAADSPGAGFESALRSLVATGAPVSGLIVTR